MNAETDNLLSAIAKMCLDCPICKTARKKQRGFAYLFVEQGRIDKIVV